MAQRISRAKQIFNEGYTASSGPDLHRADLTSEAIRLAGEVRRLLPDDGEVAGLLALMLLTDARRPARTRPDGTLVPLAEQDRSTWNAESIARGVRLITETIPGRRYLEPRVARLAGQRARESPLPESAEPPPG